ncbi:MAG: Na/Pi cotransporter family protein [Betaproteobacteria bacterium]|nr:Na/Pi cotransporter family protein [Betaproteobacteria bacterium]NCP82615.1 Na/Pi cotransporter family protein [Rhodoferax sp.]NCS62008.1 Na/Pi cotransporter family protein [Rhodoferax sp.]
MVDWSFIGGFAGGVGLFLLGMGLMTDGLRLAAGSALERTLARSTRTRWHGLATGTLVTLLVQSSSAVTVATIGFINAGLLTLGQAIWVLFGANVGTTMTGWLVALVGLKFKIDALALPLIGLGMLLRLTGAGQRRGALGTALAGFGVLFLGIDLLRVTFTDFSAGMQLPTGTGAGDVLLQVGIGLALTVLMQSSSAALAIALTAAQGGLLDAQGAAAVVIGANIGTTVTAVIAAIGATANAKRAAAAHIAFNLLTGGVALLMLPWLVDVFDLLRQSLGLGDAPAVKLALFHTAFNVLGVLLIWPLAAGLTRFLQARFVSAEQQVAQLRHLDDTVLAVPALALDALQHEIDRLGDLARQHLRATLTDAPASETGVTELGEAIARFIARLNRTSMPADSAERLPQLLRVVRYHEAVAELASEASQLLAPCERSSLGIALEDPWRQQSQAFLNQLASELATRSDLQALLPPWEAGYQSLKAALLQAGTRGDMSVTQMDLRLRALSALHRALEQSLKAEQLRRNIFAGDTVN